MKGKISITLDSAIIKQIDNIIDNIFIRNRSQAIEHLVKLSLGENRIAVILCGGTEENLRIDSNLFSVNSQIKNKPLIEHTIRKLRENNFTVIYIIARHTILTKIFEILKDGHDFGVKINYIEEKTSNGTFDSLKLIKGKVQGHFLVVYGDIYIDKISIEDLWNDHIKHNFISTIMLTTSNKPSEKGTLKVEGNKVLTFTQKPKKSDIYLVFSPVMACSSDIFEYSGSSLEKDIFPNLAEKGLLQGHISSEKEIHIHTKNDLKEIK